MPTSWWGNMQQIIEFVREWRPTTILDIGCGYAKWGLLSREYLDIYEQGNYNKEKWKTRIDAIEIWPKYILPHHSYLYNNIFIGGCTEILPGLGKYDLIIMTDVLEHLYKKEGEEFLKLLQIKGKRTILQTPLGDWPQESIFGNPHEEHKSTWEKEDFIGLPNLMFFKVKKNPTGKDIALIVLSGKNE